MKSHLVRTVLIAGLTALGSLMLNAQNQSAIAKIPFAFQSNHKSMPAGDYRIQQLNSNGLFQLNNYEVAKGEFVTASPASDAKPSQEGQLTFACSQGTCVLSQIHMPGSSVAYKRLDPSVERDMQRTLSMATMVNIRLAH
jgi:hypothetical protein